MRIAIDLEKNNGIVTFYSQGVVGDHILDIDVPVEFLLVEPITIEGVYRFVLVDGVVIQRTEQQIKDQPEYKEYISRERAKAYVQESDPLFFKYQRGEVTEQEWLDKVQEIKDRYPKN